MTLKVELQRSGSGTSPQTIPIFFRILQGQQNGAFTKTGLSDLASAKKHIQFFLDKKFRQKVELDWVDRTAE